MPCGLNEMLTQVGQVAQKQAQEFFASRMKEHIKDERLLKGFTPKFGKQISFT